MERLQLGKKWHDMFSQTVRFVIKNIGDCIVILILRTNSECSVAFVVVSFIHSLIHS